MSSTTNAATCLHRWAAVHGVWGQLLGYRCWWCQQWWGSTALHPPGLGGGR